MSANSEAVRNPRQGARMRLISGRIRQQRKKVVAPLRRGVFLLPVTITSLGLLSGFYSIVSSINGHFEVAAVMIAVAFVCDGLDGRVARASRTSSEFGVEYDSLSDVVAFGVAPACLAYTWALKPLGGIGIVIAGMFVVCGALRLARFNIELSSNLVAVHILFEIIDSAPTEPADEDRPPLVLTDARVAFSRVYFAYRPGDPVIRDLSFVAETAQVTALVGHSGGGK